MHTDDEPGTTFRRELAENLAVNLAGGLVQLVLVVAPTVLGYLTGGATGLLVGLAVGVMLTGLFWLVVVVLGVGGLVQRLRGC